MIGGGGGGGLADVPERCLHPGGVARRKAIRSVSGERGGKHGGDFLERRVSLHLDCVHQCVLQIGGVVGKHLRKLHMSYGTPATDLEQYR